MKRRIAYLGPPGTFTEEALNKYIEKNGINEQEIERLSCATTEEVIKKVDRGETDEGLVPIENSLEGSVNITLDILAFESDAKIIREITIPIKHSLIGKEKAALEEIKKIVSHPHATAQCRNFINTHFKNAEIIAANSTAEAIKMLDKEDSGVAAIGTEIAAHVYKMHVIKKDIEDNKDNKTRFVFIGNSIQPRTGSDKTSMVCFLKQDRPGSLFGILKEFAERNINLTRLESRPAKKNLGDYVFMIDLDGHIHDPEIFDAIETLRKTAYMVKILGAYPKWVEINQEI
ncbi:MAG: prephenate dehydratase [Actinobacteria bacterium]|nr:prephenate dehydratase [Actinomycetota bacterium]